MCYSDNNSFFIVVKDFPEIQVQGGEGSTKGDGISFHSIPKMGKPLIYSSAFYSGL
jgi:hypothetical protein